MSSKQVEILFICGSPRNHTSEALLALLEQGARDAGARSRRFLLSQKYIAPCRGCGYCEKTGNCILVDKQAETKSTDDYLELLDALKYADALAVVSPLFFAGPPAQLKALLDRMQPFWSRKYLLGQTPPPKRPAQIFIVGGGGDTHGYEPLVTITKSALAVAGFTIEKTQNFIGFKHAKEVAPLPTAEEAEDMAFGELAHLRKAASVQREFEKRALAAGSAFARLVSKSMVKLELQAELQLVEAEIAELKASEHETDEHEASLAAPDDVVVNEGIEIVDHIDSEFEALKVAARAAKASKAEEAIAEAKADIIGEDDAEDEDSSQEEKEASPVSGVGAASMIEVEAVSVDETEPTASENS